jgi:hypothetical protein
LTRNKTEKSDNYPRLDSTGRYKNSLYTPSRGYHPLRQPDMIRVKIGGATA